MLRPEEIKMLKQSKNKNIWLKRNWTVKTKYE
jgi:hypothetical protein